MMYAGRAEALLILLLLVIITILNGSSLTDCIASAAVFLGFLHAQHSFDLAEKDTASSQPQLGLGYLKNIHIAKEVLWVTTFLLLKSDPLLLGAIAFLLYPFWRQFLRKTLSRVGSEIPSIP